MNGVSAAIAALGHLQLARTPGTTARHGLSMATPAARGGRGNQPTTS